MKPDPVKEMYHLKTEKIYGETRCTLHLLGSNNVKFSFGYLQITVKKQNLQEIWIQTLKASIGCRDQ